MFHSSLSATCVRGVKLLIGIASVALAALGFANSPLGVWDGGAAGKVIDAKLDGNLAYLGLERAFQVIDLSRPGHPELIGSLSLDLAPHSVEIKGTRAYLGSTNGAEVDVIDVQNPTTPTGLGPLNIELLGEYSIADTSHPRAFSHDPFRIWDISQPNTPQEMGRLVLGIPFLGSSTKSVHAFGAHALVTDTHSVHYVDVSRPERPMKTATEPEDGWRFLVPLEERLITTDDERFGIYKLVDSPTAAFELLDARELKRIDRAERRGDRVLLGDSVLDVEDLERPRILGSDTDYPALDVDGELSLALSSGQLQIFKSADLDPKPPVLSMLLGRNADDLSRHHIAVTSSHVYAASRDTIEVADLTNPLVPRRLPNPANGVGNVRSVTMHPSEPFLLLIDSTGKIHSFDVRKPATPQLTDSLDSGVQLPTLQPAEDSLLLLRGYLDDQWVDARRVAIDENGKITLGDTEPYHTRQLDLPSAGDELAIIRRDDRLCVVRFPADSHDPVKLATLPGTDRRQKIVLLEDFVVVLGDALQVIDLNSPSEPVVLGKIDSINDDLETPIAIGDRIFAVDDDGGPLTVFDVSDPLRPVTLATSSPPIDLVRKMDQEIPFVVGVGEQGLFIFPEDELVSDRLEQAHAPVAQNALTLSISPSADGRFAVSSRQTSRNEFEWTPDGTFWFPVTSSSFPVHIEEHRPQDSVTVFRVRQPTDATPASGLIRLRALTP